MTTSQIKNPTRGRLFQMFANLGPYFRPLRSTDRLFFFDSLEICIDKKQEPSLRTFYGWSLLLNTNELHFNIKRFDGLFNLEGEWVNADVSEKNQQKINQSFELFITHLEPLLTVKLGLSASEFNVSSTPITASITSKIETVLQ